MACKYSKMASTPTRNRVGLCGVREKRDKLNFKPWNSLLMIPPSLQRERNAAKFYARTDPPNGPNQKYEVALAARRVAGFDFGTFALAIFQLFAARVGARN